MKIPNLRLTLRGLDRMAAALKGANEETAKLVKALDLRREFLAEAPKPQPIAGRKSEAVPPEALQPCAVAGCGKPALTDLSGIYLCQEHVRAMALGVRTRRDVESQFQSWQTYAMLPSTLMSGRTDPLFDPSPTPPPKAKPKPKPLTDIPARTRRAFGG